MDGLFFQRGASVIFATFALAFMLTIVPLPDWLSPGRPQWVALAMIYWSMALPTRIGVGTAWLTGLLLDVLTTGLLGQHALALAVMTFINLKLYQRTRVFPLWQQSFITLTLIALYMVLILWVKGIAGMPSQGWTYWIPAVTSALLWPAAFVVLRELRRRYHVA